MLPVHSLSSILQIFKERERQHSIKQKRQQYLSFLTFENSFSPNPIYMGHDLSKQERRADAEYLSTTFKENIAPNASLPPIRSSATRKPHSASDSESGFEIKRRNLDMKKNLRTAVSGKDSPQTGNLQHPSPKEYRRRRGADLVNCYDDLWYGRADEKSTTKPDGAGKIRMMR